MGILRYPSPQKKSDFVLSRLEINLLPMQKRNFEGNLRDIYSLQESAWNISIDPTFYEQVIAPEESVLEASKKACREWNLPEKPRNEEYKVGGKEEDPPLGIRGKEWITARMDVWKWFHSDLFGELGDF